MGRLVTAGLETASNSSNDTTADPDGNRLGSTSTAIESTIVRVAHSSDSRSLKCVSSGAGGTSSSREWAFAGATARTFFCRMYFYIDTLPSAATTVIMAFRSATPTTICSVRITPGGKLRLYNGSTQIGSDSALTVAVNTWYMVEMKLNVPTGGGSTGVLAAQYQ